MDTPHKTNSRQSIAGSLAGLAVAAFAGNAQQASAAGTEILPGTLVTTLNYADSGTTVGAINNISGTFSTYLQNGPDVFYTFTVLTSGNLSFVAAPAADYDLGIGLFTGTLASPTWIGGIDSGFAGQTETLTVPVLAGTTYNFVVDSAYPSAHPGTGTYALQINTSNGVTLSAVPEAQSTLMLGLGAAALGWRRRRRGAV